MDLQDYVIQFSPIFNQCNPNYKFINQSTDQTTPSNLFLCTAPQLQEGYLSQKWRDKQELEKNFQKIFFQSSILLLLGEFLLIVGRP